MSTSRAPITPAQLELVASATIDPMALYRVEEAGYRHEWIDERCLRPIGLRAEEVVGELFDDVFPGVVARRFHEAAQEAIQEARTVRYIGTTRMADGARNLEVTVTPIFTGDYIQMLTSQRDISDRILLENEREATGRRLRKLMEHTSDMLWLSDADGRILNVTNPVATVLGRSPAEVVGMSGLDLVFPDDLPYVRTLLQMVVETGPGEPVRAEIPLVHKSGAIRWLECTITNLLDDPDIGAVVVNSHDITERRLVEEQLAHDAVHDSLTGLPNRSLVNDHIAAVLDAATGETDLAAVAFVDFDGFKLINDTLGHDLGDLMICEAARRLERTLGDRAWVARLGGDEFIIVPNATAPVDVHLAIAEELATALSVPYILNGSPIYVTASIGLATGTSRSGINADELLRRADMAMYDAKRRGHNKVQLFDESLRQISEHRLETRSLLRTAIQDDRLRVQYQPIVDNSTRTVAGVEALLRWDHPTRGVVGPDEFIHVAEETGLIIEIGEWVLGQACSQLAEWIDRGYARVQATVNVSPRQLLDPAFVSKVRAALSRSGIDPTSLILEITENLIIADPASAKAVLQELADIGVGCAIDDFGMGYSSLSYLAQFPASVLKIDRSFVAALDTMSSQVDPSDDRSTALVAAIVGMAHALGLVVVAEGVETELQLVQLRRLGCEYAQGFHLARPSDAEHVEPLLRRRAGVMLR